MLLSKWLPWTSVPAGRFRGFKAGKQQPWTPLETHGWGMCYESGCLGQACSGVCGVCGDLETHGWGMCCESCCLGKACSGVCGVCGVWRWANGSFERRKKHLAGACYCESCCQPPWKGLRKRFERPWKQMAEACSCESFGQFSWKGTLELAWKGLQVSHLRLSQAPPLPGPREGSADV